MLARTENTDLLLNTFLSAKKLGCKGQGGHKMMTPEEAKELMSTSSVNTRITQYVLQWSSYYWDTLTPAQRAACEARWEELARQITERKISVL